MEKHFKLTSETKVNAFGVTLFRIQLTIDCKWGKTGDLGGWVEKEENLSGNAWVCGNAEVYGNARVYGDAWVYGDAEVYGNAWVYGDAWVYGNAEVYGNAWEKSPLQIQGTKHFFNVCAKLTIKIGCITNSFDWWNENYQEVGKREGYTEEEIREYGLYIQLASTLYKEVEQKENAEV